MDKSNSLGKQRTNLKLTILIAFTISNAPRVFKILITRSAGIRPRTAGRVLLARIAPRRRILASWRRKRGCCPSGITPRRAWPHWILAPRRVLPRGVLASGGILRGRILPWWGILPRRVLASGRRIMPAGRVLTSGRVVPGGVGSAVLLGVPHCLSLPLLLLLPLLPGVVTVRVRAAAGRRGTVVLAAVVVLLVMVPATVVWRHTAAIVRRWVHGCTTQHGANSKAPAIEQTVVRK
jgi:hypothetical protein